MVQTVRIEGLNPIQPLWDLHVSLFPLGAKNTARPENRVGLEEFRWVGDPHLKQVILFDPDKPFVLSRAELHSKSKNTPYDLRRMEGVVLRTLVAGQTVFSLDA